MMCHLHSGGGVRRACYLGPSKLCWNNCSPVKWCLWSEFHFIESTCWVLHTVSLDPDSSLKFTQKDSIEEHLQSLYEGCSPASLPCSPRCGCLGGRKLTLCSEPLENHRNINENNKDGQRGFSSRAAHKAPADKPPKCSVLLQFIYGFN